MHEAIKNLAMELSRVDESGDATLTEFLLEEAPHLFTSFIKWALGIRGDATTDEIISWAHLRAENWQEQEGERSNLSIEEAFARWASDCTGDAITNDFDEWKTNV